MRYDKYIYMYIYLYVVRQLRVNRLLLNEEYPDTELVTSRKKLRILNRSLKP